MRLATIISLLLFTCAACALQHRVERHDAIQSSILPRAFQSISRRRLGSRGIRCTSNIALRGLEARGPPGHQVASQSILLEWKKLKQGGGGVTLVTNDEENHVKVYKVTADANTLYPRVGPMVVKEVTVSADAPSKGRQLASMAEEVKHLHDKNLLIAHFMDYPTYIRMMKEGPEGHTP